MTFILKIETDNAAFECDGLQAEISRILHEAADKIIGSGRYGSTLRDINGNAVGDYHFTAPAPISRYKIKSAQACLICDEPAAESHSYCESHQFCALENCKYMASPAQGNGYCSAGCAALGAPLDYEPENGGDE